MKKYFRYLNIIIILAVCVQISLKLAWATENIPTPPDDHQEILQKEIKSLHVNKHIYKRNLNMTELEKKWTHDYQLFTSLLEKLGSQITETQNKLLLRSKNGWNFEKSLRSIAKNYHDYPELYHELMEEYGKKYRNSLREPIVIYPKRLQKRHATEKYRLAWEALLLAPSSEEIRFMQKRIFEALGEIGNNKSISVLIEAYTATCNEEVPQERSILNKQLYILQTLSTFCNEEALQTMMICLSLSDERTEGIPLEVSGFTLHQWVVRYLTDPDNKGVSEADLKRLENVKRWKSVLKGFRKDDLPIRHRQLLNQIETILIER